MHGRLQQVYIQLVQKWNQLSVYSLARYTLSLMWHPTLTTGVLPFLGLLYMNSHIFFTIRLFFTK